MGTQWHKFSVITNSEHADALACTLMEHGAEGIETIDSTHLEPPADLKKDQLVLSAYFSTLPLAEQAVYALEIFVQNLATQFPSVVFQNPQIVDVPDRDWNEQWKEHFIAFRIGRFYIYPDWSIPPAGEKNLVCIKPAMAFGTGHHPTTKLCLTVMDRFLPTESFLDVGCGSAILAVAAARGDAGTILAADCDPEAIQAARENLILNRLEDKIQLQHSAANQLSGTYTLIAANILSATLIGSAAQIAARVASSGRLLLSGLLSNEVEAVSQIYQQQGLKTIEVIPLEEWALIHMQKDETPR